MSIRIASLLVPAYVAPRHHGQTPEVYASSVVAKWERELTQRCPHVTRTRRNEQLFFNPARGLVEEKAYTLYSFSVDMATLALAEIIALALHTFQITTIIALLDDQQVADFDANEIEALSLGAHAWNEEDDS